MKIRAILVVCLSLTFLACSGNKLGQSALSGEGGEGEEGGVGICHVDGQGRYHRIDVSENAICWLPDNKGGHPTVRVGPDGEIEGISIEGASGSGGHHTWRRTGHVDLWSETHPCDCFAMTEEGPVLDPQQPNCCGKEGAYCELEDEATASSSESDAVLVTCCAEGLTCQKVEEGEGTVGKCLPEEAQCAGNGEYCDDFTPCCSGWVCKFQSEDSGQCEPDT